MPYDVKRAAMLAVALGSNFGACLTFVASLAGIMFLSILRPNKIVVTLKSFVVAGLVSLPLVLATSCFAVAVEVLIVGYNTTMS